MFSLSVKFCFLPVGFLVKVLIVNKSSSGICVVLVSTLPCKACVYELVNLSYMFTSYLCRGSSTENTDFNR